MQECGFMFMNPPFTDTVIKDFYSEDYFKGRADYSYIDEREIKKYSQYVWDKRIKVIHEYVSKAETSSMSDAHSAGCLNLPQNITLRTG